MSLAGISGMRAAAGDLIEVARSLNAAEWQAPSAATGWSVHDVVSHVGCLLELLQAAVGGEDLPDSGIESLNDMMVAERRGWDTARTLNNVEKQLEQAITVFTPLQEPSMAAMETPMFNLGTYPLHAITDMFTFDMTTHLRYDILAPRGPINRQLPPLDETCLGPSVSWLLGGIAKMQPDLAGHLTAPLALHLIGPGARNLLIRAQAGNIFVDPLRSSDEAAATLRSSTGDFLAWSTARLPWRTLVTIEGDQSAATTFLDAINLI